MATPYLGEIRMVGFNFAPQGWALCDGTLLSIAQNDALFALIGTTYGGDGQTTFALPDLRSRVPMHQGTGSGLSPRTLGQTGGEESVTLGASQIPTHTHNAMAAVNSNSATPNGTVWAGWIGGQFSDQAPNAQMSLSAMSSAGGGQPHDNMIPYQAINFIIALFGIFPSQMVRRSRTS
jgi:microcystin-dependent protein